VEQEWPNHRRIRERDRVRVALTQPRRQEYLDGVETGLTLEGLSKPINAVEGASALDRLSAASATADELRGLGDALLDRYVRAARADGRSWTEIGAALGVTKQAAHERFVEAPLAWPTNFNEPAREVVQRALTEARSFGHRYVGTEHLLLALTGDSGLAGVALADLGVDESTVRREIERIIGRGRSGYDAALGVTPRTKRVFETAIEEAKRLGSRRCADSEHLLLALGRSGGVAADILVAHGADERATRERLATLLEREAPELALKWRAPERRRGRRRARR
jgi:ClpA/ClpB-like protein